MEVGVQFIVKLYCVRSREIDIKELEITKNKNYQQDFCMNNRRRYQSIAQ